MEVRTQLAQDGIASWEIKLIVKSVHPKVDKNYARQRKGKKHIEDDFFDRRKNQKQKYLNKNN